MALTRGFDGYGKHPPWVVIWASRARPTEGTPYDLIEWEWAGWKAQTFLGKPCTAFTLFCTYQPLASLPNLSAAVEVSSAQSSGQRDCPRTSSNHLLQ